MGRSTKAQIGLDRLDDSSRRDGLVGQRLGGVCCTFFPDADLAPQDQGAVDVGLKDRLRPVGQERPEAGRHGFEERPGHLSESLLPPSSEHWFGTDIQGCDYYARTIYGARVSITIGLLVTIFATLIALIGGSAAGYYGGWTDTIIARMTDIMFVIPFILGGIVILSLFPTRGVAQVSLVLIILGWATMLRLVRSSVIAAKSADYVDAARSMGGTNWRIITKHVLPNSLAPVIVYATITIGAVISAEAALSFLGVGLQLPAISWGLMIAGAQARILTSPHLLLFPGAFLSVTVFSFILMGDALRDALDPKLR